MRKILTLSICFTLVSIAHSLAGDSRVVASIKPMPVSVWNVSQLRSLRPVTGGIPLVQGAAPDGVDFTLLDEKDHPVPLQTSVLAKWKDGSARWILLDFQAEPAPGAKAAFKLHWGKQLKAAHPESPVQIDKQGILSIRMRNVVVSSIPNALLRISDRFDIGLTMTDREGRKCLATVESAEVQTEGPMRSTLLVRGVFRDPDGKRVFGFRMPAFVFAGLSKVYFEPQILVNSESDVIHYLRDLKLTVTPLNGLRSATVGGEPGWNGAATSPVRLFQVDDRSYRFEGAPGSGSKAPGWAEIDDGKGTVAIALRDFWQQWPKSIDINPEGLAIGLFPEFENGTFDHMEPWYKYQYLFEDNCYRLRTGQAPRWRIWLDLAGEGASLSQAANTPLIPSADPPQAIASTTWGHIAPAGGPGMEEYDDWVENLFDNGYCRSIEVQRDYGQMNWGDWFGERHCNWGNHEYDTAKHILVQFARTGDPKYLYVGDAAARHTSEIDVIHFINNDLKRYFEEDLGGNSAYPVRPGMMHEHCVGHVGGFYPVERIRDLYASLGNGSHLCLAPYNLGHIWTQGMVYDYFLTGDPWLKVTVEQTGDNLAQLVEDRKFNFKTGSHVGRVNGWTMLAIAGAYELDFNERYLNAMKLLADDALSAQDPHCGGWLWELPAGHCDCKTKHVGEAGFIASVRVNGLSRYYELSGDKRIPEVVRRAVTFINNDTWLEQYSDWRYTSCPATGRVGQTGVTMAALVNSVRLNGNPEHLRILRKAWNTKFERLLTAPRSRPGLGKTYSQIMYGSPEVASFFASDACIRHLISDVDPAFMSKHLFYLSKNPLPYRKLNLTLPDHKKNTLHEADDYLTGQLEAWGYRVEREGVQVQAFRRDTSKPKHAQYSTPKPEDPWYTAYNLYAEKKGRSHPEKIILVLAHKDSQSWIDSPGANDNAIGTVGVLEMARVLTGYASEGTIRFLFCNEEHTPWTSKTAAQKAKERGDDMVAIFNMDGIGVKTAEDTAAGKKTNVTAYTEPEGEPLAKLMSEVNARFSIGLEQRIVKRSRPGDDDGSFVQAGYTAAVVNIGSWPYGDPNYHAEGDTPEKCDVVNAAMTVRATLAVIITIDRGL